MYLNYWRDSASNGFQYRLLSSSSNWNDRSILYYYSLEIQCGLSSNQILQTHEYEHTHLHPWIRFLHRTLDCNMKVILDGNSIEIIDNCEKGWSTIFEKFITDWFFSIWYIKIRIEIDSTSTFKVECHKNRI